MRGYSGGIPPTILSGIYTCCNRIAGVNSWVALFVSPFVQPCFKREWVVNCAFWVVLVCGYAQLTPLSLQKQGGEDGTHNATRDSGLRDTRGRHHHHEVCDED